MIIQFLKVILPVFLMSYTFITSYTFNTNVYVIIMAHYSNKFFGGQKGGLR